MVCLRLATHKESKETFLTPHVFGEILYENFLFDIPKLLDLCALYGASNGAILSKMIANIFIQQAKYKDDLRGTIPSIVHILENIMTKCGVPVSSAVSSPQKITSATKKNDLLTTPLSDFQDVIFYISDTSRTLWAFVDIFADGAKIFAGSPEFLLRLVSFYEGIVPVVNEAMKGRDWEGSSLKLLLRRKFSGAQVCVLKLFRQIMFTAYLQPLLEAKIEEESAQFVEQYLNIMSSILGEKRFLANYYHLFPFAEDRDMLVQSKYAVDETRLQFIDDAIHEASLKFGESKQKAKPDQGASMKNEKPQLPESKPGTVESYEEMGACAPKITGVELQSLISSVKDLLPDLGEGFIEICLEELGYDIETVINSILEDKLPPSLQTLDKKMPRDTEKVVSETKEMESSLDKRLNIYDGDEFDAFQNKLDMSKVIAGKKNKTPKSVAELHSSLDIKSLKPLYDKYGSEDVVSMYDQQDMDYEDEYDDTYDSNLIGADDADSADELTARRKFTIPRILQKGSDTSDAMGTPDASDEERELPRKTQDDFVQDPALLRQRQEERRAAQMKRGGRSHNVKGNPKGQGQDADTQKNRAWKEKHKSSRVHHNRRALADKKRKI